MSIISLTQSAISQLEPKAAAYDVRDSKVSGFLARIRPTGTISYIVQYRDITGTQRSYTIGVEGKNGWNATRAREKAKEVRFNAERGQDPHKDKREARQTEVDKRANTLRAYFEGAYQYHLEIKKMSSQKETRRIIFSEFAHLLDCPLSDITAKTVLEWRAHRRKLGRKGIPHSRALTEETLKRYNAEIDVLLARAVDDKLLAEHPLRGQIAPIKGASRSNIKPRFLSPEERKKLNEALCERDTHLKRRAESGRQWKVERNHPVSDSRINDQFADHLTPMCLLSLNTGIRQGELFLLEWADIHLNATSPTIELRAETTKASTARSLALNKDALQALNDWREQTSHSASSLIFPNSNGEVFQDVKSHWRGLMKRWKEKFNTEPANFRWHDMRHDFASQLVMSGVNINTVRELMGHTTLEMTLRYAHLSDKTLSDAVARLESKNA